MEATTTLQAERRERTGSRYAQRLRDAGRLPAIVYGHGVDPIPLSLDAKETIQHIERGEKVFTIEFDGKRETVLVRELQFDYLGNNIVHADLSLVDLEERVKTHVHIHLVGDAQGLKTSGAVLMHPTTQIEIECTVFNMPEQIEVDVSELDAHGSIHASEVQLPKPTMVLLSDPDAVVAQIIVKGSEGDDTGEAGAVGGAEAPERIGEKADGE